MNNKNIVLKLSIFPILLLTLFLFSNQVSAQTTASSVTLHYCKCNNQMILGNSCAVCPSSCTELYGGYSGQCKDVVVTENSCICSNSKGFYAPIKATGSCDDNKGNCDKICKAANFTSSNCLAVGSTGNSPSNTNSDNTASQSTPPPPFPNPLASISSPQALIGKIINAVLGVVGSLALLMFVYGGLIWMTSSGNQEKVKKGRDIVIWAAIGLLVIFMSYGLVRLLISGVSK